MAQLIGDASGLGWVAVKAVLLFAVAVIGLRLGERRTLAHLSAFDFAVAVAIGAIIGRGATASDTSFASSAVALITLLVAHRLIAIGRRHSRVARLIDHAPRVLAVDGELQERELARAGLTDEDVYALLREHGVGDLGQVRYLLYEPRGSVTVVGVGHEPGPLVRDRINASGYCRAARVHGRRSNRYEPISLDDVRSQDGSDPRSRVPDRLRGIASSRATSSASAKEFHMSATEPSYFTAFKNFEFTRTPSGVLTLRFHTGGGPATFTGQLHSDFPRALYEIGQDRDNRVLVVTGTGDRFMTDIDGSSLDDPTKPAVWDNTTAEGRRIMQRLVDLEMPIVAAVNGPASVHSEYVLVADIIVAADTTVFSDFPHPAFGLVPGDGIYLAWEETIGLNRARYLTMTQGSFTAQQAEQWGAVAEVLPLSQVLPRAQELAESLAAKPQLLTRYLAITVRQRLSRRMAEAYQLGSALEGLTGADIAYQQH
ncbi:MAG TPA: enoyl-CoA hydratase-related protein [Streptosporangiaceae bacterium]